MSEYFSLTKISSETSEMPEWKSGVLLDKNCYPIFDVATVKATSHSTFFDIPMRPLREDQRHRRRFTG